MKVTLRQRNKSGKISLYLDIYHKGKRKREYLRLYLVDKPRSIEERAFNKKTLQLAKNIATKRQLELQSGIYGFADSKKVNSSFQSILKCLLKNVETGWQLRQLDKHIKALEEVGQIKCSFF